MAYVEREHDELQGKCEQLAKCKPRNTQFPVRINVTV